MPVLPDNHDTLSYLFTQQVIARAFTCAGAGRFIFAGVYVDRYAAEISSVVYAGAPLALIQKIDFPANYENRYMSVFGLLNPAAGSNNLVVTLSSGNTNGYIAISSYKETLGLRGSAKIALNRSGAGETRLEVPSESMDLIVDFLALQITGPFNPAAEQTERFRYPGVPTNYIAGSDRIGQGGSTPMKWDMVPASAYESAMIGASLMPAQIRGGGGGNIMQNIPSVLNSLYKGA